MKPQFDAGRAMGFFFEVFKARPAAFIVLSVWTVIYAAAFAVFQMATVSEELQQFVSVYEVAPASDNPEDIALMMSAMGSYFAALAPFFAVSLVLGVIVESAWLRLFVKGQDSGLFPFRLGRDEVVYALAGLILVLILIVAGVIGFMVDILLVMVFMMGGTVVGMLGVGLGVIAFMVVVLAVVVRISPVLALSVLQGRLQVGAGISGSQHFFWSLLGSFVVAMVVMMIAYGLIAGLNAFLPINEYGLTADGSLAPWPQLFGYYAAAQTLAIIPMAMFRGIASYAALQIAEANRPLADTFE